MVPKALFSSCCRIKEKKTHTKGKRDQGEKPNVFAERLASSHQSNTSTIRCVCRCLSRNRPITATILLAIYLPSGSSPPTTKLSTVGVATYRSTSTIIPLAMGGGIKWTRPSPRHNRQQAVGWAVDLAAAATAEDYWWKPDPGVNWDWRLSGIPRASAGVDMFYIDLFDVTTNQIQGLRDADIVVICSFSAGTYEDYREDEDSFPLTALGYPKVDSEGEFWININDEGILTVMNARLDLATEKGCDGVGPDAVEAYTLGAEVTGWEITADDQLTYNQWLANQSHARNLSVGLKNDVDQLTELEPYFDWALATDCYTLGLCDKYEAFTGQGKAVVAAEFFLGNLTLCDSTYAESIDFIVKGSELDDQRCSCGFPDTNVECSSLLAANIPTEPPSNGGPSDDGLSTPTGDGNGVDEAPTWLIVTVIAVVVFIAMVACGAYAWRKRLKRLGKWGDSTTQGVDDFCS